MTKNDTFFLKAKKSLGQHFLRSEKALMQIVEAIEPRQVVFEIGPGEGVLTEKLLEKGNVVYAIEIDQRSIEILKEKFANHIENKKLFIIEKDCLEVDYAPYLASSINRGGTTQYSLVGNIPYYITGAIFRQTFEQKVLPKEVVFLIQKEVAERIVARDGKESLLSVSVKIFSESVKIVDIVKAGSFVPPPKVDSAILAIKGVRNPFDFVSPPFEGGVRGGYNIFFKILKAAFSHKRKFLLTNLKTDLDKDVFEKYSKVVEKIILENCSAEEKTRAEDVSIETWKKVIHEIIKNA